MFLVARQNELNLIFLQEKKCADRIGGGGAAAFTGHICIISIKQQISTDIDAVKTPARACLSLLRRGLHFVPAYMAV